MVQIDNAVLPKGSLILVTVCLFFCCLKLTLSNRYTSCWHSPGCQRHDLKHSTLMQLLTDTLECLQDSSQATSLSNSSKVVTKFEELLVPSQSSTISRRGGTTSTLLSSKLLKYPISSRRELMTKRSKVNLLSSFLSFRSES